MTDILAAYQQTAVNLLKNPDCPESLSNQFTILAAKGELAQSHLMLARRCAEIAPHEFIAVFNLGSAQMRAGQYFDSLQLFLSALEIANDEQRAIATHHVGLAWHDIGDMDKALEWYGKALKLYQPRELRESIAIAKLMKGELGEGLFEFECKYHKGSKKKVADQIPRWMGEDLTGKKLIICHEQGFGDTIQFSRFVGETGAEWVIWSGPRVLHRLIEENFEFAEMVDEEGPFDADFYCSPISICGALRKDYASVSGVPYLKAEPIKLQDRGLKVGLSWAGNKDYAHDAHRSMKLSDFMPLMEVPGASFYSLQVGRGSEEITKLGLDGFVANLGGTLNDWKDTARAIMAMDVVVATDSANAHLAGALGKPVLLLLPYSSCWRWMRDRTDTPWYANTRLFRQFKPGDWSMPIAHVTNALTEMLNGRTTAVPAKPVLRHAAGPRSGIGIPAMGATEQCSV